MFKLLFQQKITFNHFYIKSINYDSVTINMHMFNLIDIFLCTKSPIYIATFMNSQVTHNGILRFSILVGYASNLNGFVNEVSLLNQIF